MNCRVFTVDLEKSTGRLGDYSTLASGFFNSLTYWTSVYRDWDICWGSACSTWGGFSSRTTNVYDDFLASSSLNAVISRSIAYEFTALMKQVTVFCDSDRSSLPETTCSLIELDDCILYNQPDFMLNKIASGYADSEVVGCLLSIPLDQDLRCQSNYLLLEHHYLHILFPIFW